MLGSIGLHGIKMDGIVLYTSLCNCRSRMGSCGRWDDPNSHEPWLCRWWPYRWLVTRTKSWEFLFVGFPSETTGFVYTNL
jgi:hypothetical protein